MQVGRYMIMITKELSKEAKWIREEVFVKEQGFKEEFDEVDEISTHIVLLQEETKFPMACCRYYKKEKEYIVGRIAVLKKYRGKQFGQLLLQTVEKEVTKAHGKKLSLSAQKRIQSFYEQQGYVAIGEPYFDEFCEHIWMEKML